MGYVLFCSKNPTHCQNDENASDTAVLTDQRRATLRAVNSQINASVRARHDNLRGSLDDEWRIALGAGDCEDFALTKRDELLRRGWPAATLRIAVARTTAGEGHAVLVVRTSIGDLILDNRNNAILPWQRSNLRWVKIQSGSNPRLWFKI